MKKLLLIAMQFSLVIGYAQTNYRSDKIVPASPTAASLGKYGNVDVSAYSGSPDISVPLYSIKTNNHALDLVLRYDATGTKVAQDASWVGLGWSLETGGVISRIVRGGDDFSSHGYYYTQVLPPNAPDNTWQYNTNYPNDKIYFDAVYSNDMDGEPDIYSYNFGGFHGKFVIGKNSNGAAVFMDEKNNLKVEYNGGWVITTGEGYKYYFATPERTQGYTYSSPVELTNLTGVSGLNFDVNSTPVTAWYLDSIVAPSGETISFSYVNGKSLSLMNRSEQLYQLTSIAMSGCVWSMPVGFYSQYHGYSANRDAIRDVYLQKISFVNGSVEFNTSPRSDIEYINNADGLLPPSKLDNIVVKDKDGNQLRQYAFAYSYFNNQANSNGRLKLDAVTESGGGITNPPYTFTYILPNNLPDKYTKNVDYWGFYNYKGQVASSLLPTMDIPNVPQFVGADKEPDTIQNYQMYGVLSRIQYPTGGSTSFEYELHDYGNLHGEQLYAPVPRFESVRADPTNHPGQDETLANFTIHPDPVEPNRLYSVQISCSYQKVNQSSTDPPSLGYTNMWRVNPDGSLSSVADCSMANYDQPNNSPYNYSKNLAPGNYRMLLQSVNGFSTFMSCSWEERSATTLTRRKGGGIRIRTVTSTDATGIPTVKRYLYTGDNGITSGVLMAPVKYDYSFSVTGGNPVIGSGIVAPCDYTAFFFGATSGSIFPSGLSIRSGIIGYSKVTELQGEHGENGRTEFYYHNAELTGSFYPNIPPVPDPMNGKLDKAIVYNAAGEIVKETDYAYQVKEDNVLKGVKLFTSSPIVGDYAYFIEFYDNRSSWVVPVQEKETLYNTGGGITTTTTYHYDNYNHRQPTQIDMDRSDGSVSMTTYRRPDEFIITGAASSTIAQGIQNLQNNHIITPVIEQYVQRANSDGSNLRTVAASFTSYKSSVPFVDVSYKGAFLQPLTDFATASITASGTSLDTRYVPQMTVDAYDARGNVIQRHQRDNTPHAYIWDYQQAYPIAEVVNSAPGAAAYTSFEAEGSGGWTLSPGNVINNTSIITGQHSCSGSVTKIVPAGNYIVSLWAAGTVTVNGQTATVLRTSNRDGSWHYYEWKLSNVSQVQAQGANMDEVRLYPDGAHMTTYTYAPLIGMTCQTDVNNKIIYYEYDGQGRLKNVKDQDGNVLKTIDYHYQGQ